VYFNPNTKLKTKLRYVKHYNPISFKTLEIDNEDLYLLLKKKSDYSKQCIDLKSVQFTKPLHKLIYNIYNNTTL